MAPRGDVRGDMRPESPPREPPRPYAALTRTGCGGNGAEAPRDQCREAHFQVNRWTFEGEPVLTRDRPGQGTGTVRQPQAERSRPSRR